MISAERVREVLEYDPETGTFIRIASTSSRAVNFLGKPAGHHTKEGYINILIDGRMCKAHRLAWLYVYGVWPRQLDHINRNRSDNRIANLRECTQAQNRMNVDLDRKRNKSGFKGVHFNKNAKKWCAMISHEGKTRYLGYFTTAQEAADAYEAAAVALYGEFALIPHRIPNKPSPIEPTPISC